MSTVISTKGGRHRGSLPQAPTSGSDPLPGAIREFQAILSTTQKGQLLAQSTKPDATSILAFTAEVDKVNADRRSRCVSSRLFGILQSIQDYTSIVDTFVSAHPEIAALLWGTIKFTVLVYSYLLDIKTDANDR